MDALVEAQDARALVRSLPAEDLYTTIQEVGLADASELVQLVSPRQFQTFLDLGSWERDTLDAHRVLTWLRAARGEEPGEFIAKLEKMDLELLELVLRRFARVHSLEETPDVHVEGVTLETPEGKYLVELTVEGAEQAALRTLVNDLLAQNPFEAVRLLEAVRWEVPGELEEQAFRFRTARLADLGFPSPEEGASLFAYADPERFPVRGHATRAALLPPGERVDYLEAVVRALDEDERDALEGELRLTANQALVAEGAEPGDVEAQRSVLEMVRDVLNLGLEHATGGDPERAVDVLREEHLKRLFQLGFSLTLKLKFRADRLMRLPLARVEGVPLLFPREAAGVSALRQRRPRRALKVDGAEPVPFRNRRELAESAELLSRAEAQVVVLGALLGGTRDAADEAVRGLGRPLVEVGVEGLFTAAVAHAVRTGEARVAPVPQRGLAPLLAALFTGTPEAPAVRPEARSRAREVLAAAVPPQAHAELDRLLDVTFERLLDELGRPFLSGTVLPTVAEALLPLERT